jgi:hypothetical protein
MDGTVDNLMDNLSGCPQVDTLTAHKLTHDGLFRFQQQDVYILFSVRSCLDRGYHLASSR